jgi:type IV fimbrial biogenesis protein FimT
MLPPSQATAPRGVTLVELLVGLAVLGVLLAVGVPSFNGLLGRWRQQAAVDTFVADIQLARSTATRTSRPVVMCALDVTNPQRCTAGVQWMTGWIVFLDANGNDALDAGESEIVRRPPPPGLAQMTQQNATAQMTFRSNGSLSGINARVVLQARGSDVQPQTVVLSNAGRARVSP